MKEIKEGDYVWVSALTESWLAIARTAPFVTGEHILQSPTEVVLVKTPRGNLWQAPTYLIKKLDSLSEEMKKEAL